MRWVCVVIMWSLQTRIEKSFSYSNLKVPTIMTTSKRTPNQSRWRIWLAPWDGKMRDPGNEVDKNVTLFDTILMDRFHVTSSISKKNYRTTKVFIPIRHNRRYIYICLQLILQLNSVLRLETRAF